MAGSTVLRYDEHAARAVQFIHKHRPLYHFTVARAGFLLRRQACEVRYTKPHLTYPQQVEKLTSRGLACADESVALELLKTVGYYRVSAYVYPFRELLPTAEQSGVRYRSNTIREGASWENVRDLWAFDRALRLLCLDASETIEVGVRTKIAYVLGARNVFGHTDVFALDPGRCARPRGNETEFDNWMRRYRDLERQAKNEDFVKHHRLEYAESELPVWVAVELLDFGAVTRLFSLMKTEDQNQIARAVGVTSGKKLHSMLLTLAYVRNLGAHHGRTWNRVLTVKLRKIHETEVGPDLRHLDGYPLEEGKLYAPLAIMAYLVRQIDPRSDCSRKLRERVERKFPKISYLSPQVDMGFPPGWADLPLWRDPPRG